MAKQKRTKFLYPFNERPFSKGKKAKEKRDGKKYSVLFSRGQKQYLPLSSGDGRGTFFTERSNRSWKPKGCFLFEGFLTYPSHRYIGGACLDTGPYWTKGRRLRFLLALSLWLVGLFLFIQESAGAPTYATLAFMLATVIGAYDFFRSSLLDLRKGRPNLRSFLFLPFLALVILGYWKESALFVLLSMVNEAIERMTLAFTRKTSKSPSPSIPEEVLAVKKDGLQSIPLKKVKRGERIRIAKGEVIPLDGQVLNDQAVLDWQPILGIGKPKKSKRGEIALAGAINLGEAIDLLVERPARESRYLELQAFIAEAEATEPPVLQFVKNLMVYFSPVLVFLTLSMAVLPPLVIGANWSPWIYTALAIYIVAQPCILLMATPLPFQLALTRSRERGILLKNTKVLEELHRLQGIAFDLKGSLTHGELSLTEIVAEKGKTEEDLIALALAVFQAFPHPALPALDKLAKERNIRPFKAEQHEQKKENCYSAKIGGKKYEVINLQELSPSKQRTLGLEERMASLEKEIKSLWGVFSEEEYLGFFALEDPLRQESKDALRRLRRTGVKKFFILTEDEEGTSKALAEALGIQDVYATLTVEEKMLLLDRLLNKHSCIGFIRSTTEVKSRNLEEHGALQILTGLPKDGQVPSFADIVFLQASWRELPWLITLSKKTMATVKRNIYVVFSLKLFALLLVIPNVLTVPTALCIDSITYMYIYWSTKQLTKKIQD